MPTPTRAGASARKVARRRAPPRKTGLRKTAPRQIAPKKSPPHAKTSRINSRVAPYQSCTSEMEANIRHRYEETDEPVERIAADRGVASGSLRRIARVKGWVRRKHRGPKDVTEAMRILAEAERLEKEIALPPPGGGRSAAQRPGGDESQSQQDHPTPDGLQPSNPPPPGEGGTAPAAPLPAEELLATIARLEAAVRAELSTVEAMRAAYGSEPYKPYHSQLTTRTLSNLTDTLGKLTRLRAALAAEPQPVAAPQGPTYDDYPADIDEFRREFARRVEAFIASRTDAGRAAAAGPAGRCDPV
jgi:hypothetical protein